MTASTVVLINTHAGSAQTAVDCTTLATKFKLAGIDADVHFLKSGLELIAAAKSALTSGVTMIVAGGGDGSISAVAALLAGSSCALGVLPVGTLNHFAKDLGIPLLLDEAIAVIAAGHVETIDTGEVNGRIFINNSSLGIYPDIVRSRQNQQRRLGRSKWPAFVTATIMALRRFAFITIRLTTDGLEQSRKTAFFFVGNNSYSLDGLSIGGRTSLQNGILSLYVARGTSRLGLMRLAFKALIGRIEEDDNFDALQVRELRVETHRRRLPVATDGEVTWLQTPLHYRIRPRSLKVIVPAPLDSLS